MRSTCCTCIDAKRALVGVLLLLSGGAVGASSLDRWAIVGDQSVADAGVIELVTVELASSPDIELVERGDIARVLEEQEISLLAQATETARRIEMGRLLRADAILLLAASQQKNAGSLRVTIIDCRTGTRLWVRLVAAPQAGVEECVAGVVKAAKQTRERFAGGIRNTVGVLPFLSDDLAHDFDHLQLGLCRLLQEELLSVAGIAVIEVEEARAISAELQGRTGEIDARSVPIIIEGKYSTTPSKGNAPPRLNLTIHLRHPSTSKTVERISAPLTEVESVFRGKVVAAVLRTLDINPTDSRLSSRQQFGRLVARAESMAGLGAWTESIGLREAALLIRPADASLRKAMIDEYLRLIGNTRSSPGKDREECLECIRLWRITREHVDYLIRNRMVTQSQACTLVRRWIRSLYVVRVDHSRMLKDCESEKKQFLVNSFKRVQALERGTGGIPGWDDIHSFFLEHLITRLDGNFRDDDDLEPLLDLVSQFAPKARFTSQDWAYALSAAGSHSEPAHATFCKALQSSTNAGIAAAGRYADLCRRYGEVAGTKEVTPDMLKEAQAIRKALEEAGALDFYLKSKTGATVTRIKRDVARFHIPERTRPGSDNASSRPTLSSQPSARPAPAAVEAAKPRVELEQLLFTIREAKNDADQGVATKTCSVLDVLNCEEFDVLWSETSLHLHKKKGELIRVLADSDALLEDVKWDGKYLWVGTRCAGVWTYDRAGTLLSRITAEDGLPPVAENIWRADDARSLLLHPVGEGKVLMVAQIKQNPGRSRSPVRSWCAMITYRQARGEVNVFHEARRILGGGEDPKPLLLNPEMGFRPTWISEHRDLQTGNRHVYVGRDFLDGMWRAGVFPLRIDVDTLEVDVAKSRPKDRPIALPPPFAKHRDLLAPLSDRPGRWGVSSLLGVVSWPRRGGVLQKVMLIPPDPESAKEKELLNR